MPVRTKSNRVTSGSPGPGSTGAAPAWVKMLGAVALVLVTLFVGLHLTGHGFGPHAHMSMARQAAQPR